MNAINEPYLYILMRTDLDSLNEGKAIAQGTHAGHVFSHRVTALRRQFGWSLGSGYITYDAAEEKGFVSTKQYYDRVINTLVLVEEWEKQAVRTPGFGVTITLDIENEKRLHDVVTGLNKMGVFAGVAHDETYPVNDGEITHLIPVTTCGYAFGNKPDMAVILAQFDLHP
jgi:hypothetical protein